MHAKHLSIGVVVLAVLFIGAISQAQGLHRNNALYNGVPLTAFNNSAKAGMLRNAYDILETGDHDYQGHRVKAMHAIEAAAKHLGVILRGDDKDRPPQALSDEKLREARGLLQNVLGAAEVKSQRRISWRINEAISDINTALSIR